MIGFEHRNKIGLLFKNQEGGLVKKEKSDDKMDTQYQLVKIAFYKTDGYTNFKS